MTMQFPRSCTMTDALAAPPPAAAPQPRTRHSRSVLEKAYPALAARQLLQFPAIGSRRSICRSGLLPVIRRSEDERPLPILDLRHEGQGAGLEPTPSNLLHVTR